MKKSIIICLVVLLCVCGALPVGATTDSASGLDQADGAYATAADLFESYYKDGYPDYIAGIWTENGTSYPITIALTDDAAGKAGRQEVLRLIADDNSVTFATATYSYNYLKQAQEAVIGYMKQDIGIYGCGVVEKENRVSMMIYEEKVGDPVLKAALADLAQTWGNIFTVARGDGIVSMVTEVGDFVPAVVDESPWSALLVLAVVALCLCGLSAAVIYRMRRQRMAVAVTSAGTVTVCGDRPMTEKELTRAIKESQEAPPPSLEDEILRNLKERQ